MKKKLRTLAIVPARGGSKGVPGKNIRPLAGRPLIVRTLEAAQSCGCCARVIVTTDSAEIRSVVLNHGFEAPFLRPPELAKDDTPLIAAITHALAWCERDDGPYDLICLLQPTSPFRTAAHIRSAFGLFAQRQPDSLVSVVQVPHRFVPRSLMREQDGWLQNYTADATAVSRHNDERLWARNGPAILLTRAEEVRGGRFYGKQIVGFPMDFVSSIDIDEEEDWDLAERIARP